MGRIRGVVICRVSNGVSPDVIMLSLGLWHMLHITSVESFSHDMGALHQAADAFVASKQPAVDKVLIYISPPSLLSYYHTQYIRPGGLMQALYCYSGSLNSFVM